MRRDYLKFSIPYTMIVDEELYKYTLPTLVYLSHIAKCIVPVNITIRDILEMIGYNTNTNLYGGSHIDGIRDAFEYLRQANYISSIIDCSTKQEIAPEHLNYTTRFSVKFNELVYHEKFITAYTDDIVAIMEQCKGSAIKYNQALRVYLHIAYWIKVSTDFRKFPIPHMLTKHKLTIKELGNGFNDSNFLEALKTLEEAGVIKYKAVSTLIRPLKGNGKPYIYGIGTVIMFNGGRLTPEALDIELDKACEIQKKLYNEKYRMEEVV